MAVYNFVELTSGGTSDETFANGINDSGEVVGSHVDASGQTAFLYQGGNYTDISDPNATDGTFGIGLNASGEVIGTYFEGNTQLGFLYDGATFTTISEPDPDAVPGKPTQPVAINASGEVVGFYFSTQGEPANMYKPVGFLYNAGTYTTISYPGSGNTYAVAINDAGTIGGAYEIDGKEHGFLLTGNTFTTIDDPDATTSTEIVDINNAGEAVGTFADAAGTQSFLYDKGVYTTISDPDGAKGTFAQSLNATGQVTGYFETASGQDEAFVYSDGAYTTLDVPGATSNVSAYGINDAGQVVGTYDDADGQHGFIATPACYMESTLVQTTSGEVPVEELIVGDCLVTASGEHRPIRWIGHRRLDITKHPDPRAVWPVRISASAFGHNLPRRDLWMSPGHNVFVEGVLMPIRVLINGATVVQEPVDTVTYWHVELDSHDVILAEGLSAESYLDTGNRSAFANAGPAIELNPDFEPKHWTETCVPLVKAGPEVEAARRMLLARAEEIGHATTAVHDLHVVAGGRRVAPIALGPKRFAFTLPAGCEAITLASRTFVPCHVDPEATDSRVLGVRVRRLQVDGEEIDLRTLPADGWHAAEAKPDHVERWMRSEAPLPPHARLVVVDLAGEGRYWIERKDNVVAMRA